MTELKRYYVDDNGDDENECGDWCYSDDVRQLEIDIKRKDDLLRNATTCCYKTCPDLYSEIKQELKNKKAPPVKAGKTLWLRPEKGLLQSPASS